MKLLVAVIVCCVRLSVAFQHSSLCLSFVLNIRRFYSHLGYFVGLFSFRLIFNSYATICPPLQGDNPRVLASRLSPLQADKPPVREIFYSLKLVDYLLVEADKPCLLLRDDPRGLASELSPVQGGGGGAKRSEDLAQYEIFRAEICNIWQGWCKVYHAQLYR